MYIKSLNLSSPLVLLNSSGKKILSQERMLFFTTFERRKEERNWFSYLSNSFSKTTILDLFFTIGTRLKFKNRFTSCSLFSHWGHPLKISD